MYDESVVDRILNTDLENEGEIEQVLKAQGVSERAAHAIKAALRLLNAFKDELPNDILNTLASLAGYGYAPAPTGEIKAAKPSSDDDSYGDYGYGEYGDSEGKKKPPKRATAEAEARALRRESVKKAMLGLCGTRSEVWESIREAARAMFGDDSPQSIDALLSCPTGARLYAAYLEAAPDPIPEPVSKTSSDDDDGDVPIWQEIKRQARQQVAKAGESLSEAESIARFLNSPAGRKLYKEYLRQKEELIARRRHPGR